MEPPDFTDDQVVDALRQDDSMAASAFDWLVQRYGERLVIFAYRLTGDRDVAYDVAQDVFVWAWERRELLAHASSIRAYLYGAARHRVMDLLRRERRTTSWRVEPGDRAPGMGMMGGDPSSSLETAELERAIQAALSALPPRMHQIATLRWADGLLPAEIAQILGVSVSTVSNTLTTAAKALRFSLIGHKNDRTG